MAKGLTAMLFVSVMAGVTLWWFLPKKTDQTIQERSGAKVGSLRPIAEAKEEWKSEVHSGDGTVRLLGTGTEAVGGGTEYTFRVAEKMIFSKTVGEGESMEIPYNSWSPDNKQFFISEITALGTNYLVFRANGEKYANGEDFLDVGGYWIKSGKKAVIKTITGWGGDDLLVVKSEMADGTGGASYWFVTSSRNFLQLRH